MIGVVWTRRPVSQLHARGRLLFNELAITLSGGSNFTLGVMFDSEGPTCVSWYPSVHQHGIDQRVFLIRKSLFQASLVRFHVGQGFIFCWSRRTNPRDFTWVWVKTKRPGYGPQVLVRAFIYQGFSLAPVFRATAA